MAGFAIATISLMLLCALSGVVAVPLLNGFYPHGLIQGDSLLQRSTGAGPSYQNLQLTQAANFYGNSYSSITVSSNGVIAFGSSFSPAQEPISFPAPSSSPALLAPFWAQADYTQGSVHFRDTDSSVLLERAGQEITQAYSQAETPLPGTVSPSRLVIVTWNNLRSTPGGSINTFQCIIAISSSSTYVFFHYADNQMSWTGDPPAMVGFNAGDGTASFTVPTSMTSLVLDVAQTGNSGLSGKWLFKVDGSEVEIPGLIIGLTKTDITMPEMGMVELCAQVRTGVIHRQETITVSAMDITTSGESDYTRRLIRPLHFGPTANRTQCPTIFIDEDTTYEVDEVFEIRIAAALSSSAVAVLPSMAKITILDDDTVSVKYTSTTVVEEDRTAQLCAEVVLTRGRCNIERDVELFFAIYPGDAEEGVDYTGNNGTVIIQPPRCSGCLAVTIINDRIFEERETFHFTVISHNDKVRVNDTSATVTITDRDGPLVRVGLTNTSLSTHEGGQIPICAQISGEISQPLRVSLQTGYIEDLVRQTIAIDGQDLLGLNEEFVFHPSRPNEVLCTSVTTLTDNVYEGTEYRGIVLTADADITIEPDVAVLEILDNNELSVAVERSNYTYREGQDLNGHLAICANMSGAIERNLHINVDFHAGTATKFDFSDNRDGDVGDSIPDIVFEVADASSSRVCDPVCTACTQVRIVDDNILEDKYENFTLSLRHSDPAVHLNSTLTLVNIEDDDTVQLYVTKLEFPSGLSENSSGSPEFCIRRTGLSLIDFTVQAIPHGVTATENEDFTATIGRVAFAGSSSRLVESKCGHISLTILEDLVVEGEETLELLLLPDHPDRMLVQSGQSRTLSITDNDMVSVKFTQSSARVWEGEGRVEVCVEMTGYSAIPLTVLASPWPGTALAGTDFLPESQLLRLPPTNQTLLDEMYSLSVADRLHHPLPVSSPVCTNISIIDNDVLELVDSKTFILNLTQPDASVTVSTPSTLTVTITDDDNVTIVMDEASRNVSVAEGEAVRVCARMLGTADFTIHASLRPRALPDSAEAGMDFLVSEQDLSFPPDESPLQCVLIPTQDDQVVETEEEFQVELLLPERDDGKIRHGNATTVLIRIIDDDYVSVGFEASEYSVLEGEGVVEVCAEMVGQLDTTVAVFFSVPEPPATQQGERDFDPISSIPFFEGPSALSSRRECANISISNDSILEDTEHFDVALSSEDPAVRVTQGSSRVYILDDDGVRVGLRERDIVVPEGEGQTIPLCLEIAGRFQSSINVTLESQSDSAQAGSDFNVISTTLTFEPSSSVMQEACVNVSVIDDSTFEEDESFAVSLRVDHEGVSIHIRETRLTILDDDSITLGLISDQATLAENAQMLDVCVELTGETERSVPYQIEIVPIDATLGSDFNFTTDPLTHFPPTPLGGSLQVQCQPISIQDDAILENTEHFEVLLIVPVGAPRVLGGTSRMRVAITDNDMVEVGFTRTEIEVDEDASEEERRAEVCVQMVGEIEKEVSVSVRSQPGSADVQDFGVVNEDLFFSPGPAFNPLQCFVVSVHPDRLVEGSEFFFLEMSSESLGVQVGPTSARITITDEDVVCLLSSLDTSRGYFSWPETYPGEVAAVLCENGTAARHCSRSGHWEKPAVSSCYVSTNELFRYLERHGFSKDNLKELLFATQQLSRENEVASSKYAEVVDQIFQEFHDQVDSNIFQAEQEMFRVALDVLNAVQTWPQDIMKELSSNIVHSFEKITENLFKMDDFTTFSRSLPSLSFHSEKSTVPELFPQSKPALRYFFSESSGGKIQILNGESRVGDYKASITLPKSLSEYLTGSEVGVFLSYYDSGNLFPLEANSSSFDADHYMRVSPVVAASFPNHELSGLRDSVIITLKLEVSDFSNVTCVSWDFQGNDGLGSWVEDGCELVSMENGEATCACSHLTNFACLIDDSPPSTGPVRPHFVANTLSVLSIIGVCFSILGLLLTIITLLVFGKLRKRDSTKFRLQLCIAMILMLVFFVIGIYQVETMEICVMASGLLHYFTLVSAMWIASDALLMLLKLTLVFSHPSMCYVVVVSLLSWLLPIPVVVAPIAIDTDFVISREYCFISHTLVFFTTLLGPIALLTLFTLAVFLIAVCFIFRYSTRKFKDTKKALKRKGACSSMFSIFSVMLLFGLTWVFGAFTVRGGPAYFRYLFMGFNSLQGLFVFLFFAVFAKETSDLWLQTCGCKKKRKRETMVSAITGVVPRKPKRMALNEDADRLKAMEETDDELRLRANTWDIMMVMPQSQFGAIFHADGSARPVEDLEQGVVGRELSTPPPPVGTETQLPDLSRLRHGLVMPDASSQHQQGASPPRQESVSSEQGAGLEDAEGAAAVAPRKASLGHSPTHSLDSAQNAMECMSTADSGILMDKTKGSPTPPPSDDLQHPQSGSTPRHIHSVSGIGYVSADSSMENLPQKEEDCYIRREPIKLAPSLKPCRAVPNEYAMVNVDNICPSTTPH